MHVISVNYSELPVGLTSHFHDCHQLIYVIEGTITASINGTEYTATSGSLLILSRFEQHSIRVLSPSYRRYRLLISNESSPCLHDNYLLSSVLTNRGEGFLHVINIDESRPMIEEIFRRMVTEYSNQALMHSDMMDLNFQQLLIAIHRCHPEIFLAENNHNNAIIREIQTKFEQHYSDAFTLAGLASDYHISQSYLAHLFKKITGYAPMEYLQACRLSAAKRYLVTTELPIKEIIFRCGFSDESNFSRMFKVKNGMTPTKFREEN